MDHSGSSNGSPSLPYNDAVDQSDSSSQTLGRTPETDTAPDAAHPPEYARESDLMLRLNAPGPAPSYRQPGTATPQDMAVHGHPQSAGSSMYMQPRGGWGNHGQNLGGQMPPLSPRTFPKCIGFGVAGTTPILSDEADAGGVDSSCSAVDSSCSAGLLAITPVSDNVDIYQENHGNDSDADSVGYDADVEGDEEDYSNNDDAGSVDWDAMDPSLPNEVSDAGSVDYDADDEDEDEDETPLWCGEMWCGVRSPEQLPESVTESESEVELSSGGSTPEPQQAQPQPQDQPQPQHSQHDQQMDRLASLVASVPNLASALPHRPLVIVAGDYHLDTHAPAASTAGADTGAPHHGAPIVLVAGNMNDGVPTGQRKRRRDNEEEKDDGE
ncbi:Uu.00g016700.m01.CDS01 [Anthostomella pinea]|uniref:Uu.00g016700.m01.CDS01 n=1 Tax=Anthostomella pinea TaxID=933095 RepID=A0AAI8YQL3_9PEZI|nr:Uu.00g016700.m01.CDS01 [Anthostomella pinea]